MRPLAMESASMNPYEQQLYTVFKTFDVDNEEALDKSAVLDLCDALQLEDRGAALVGTLFERSAERVTFTQFRNGLLSVLSGDSAPEPGPTAPTPRATLAAPPATGTTPSDEDSSGREIAPKFVFGSKKYGRRSRPQRGSADSHAPRAASVSRLDADDGRARSSQRMRCRRSASAMETRDLNSTTDDEAAADAFDHDRRINRDQALALCRNLRMDGIDRCLVDRIFDDSHADDTTTVGEFFDRLNASLTSSIEGAHVVVDLDPDDTEDDDAGVASELVVDAWERAGVPRPRRLLLELGFGSAAVRPPDLDRALDDELTALAEPLDERRDARSLLLIAALALARLRLRRARRRADLATAERDKLRADVAEANRRARLLAQDVDETHARMEAELAANLRRVETRHAEAARQAAEEAAAERERAAALRARLETETARHTEVEARLRADIDAERSRGERLEARAMAAENRATGAEREVSRLADEIRLTEERRGLGAAGAGGGDAALRDLEARLEELRREAQMLRDRNDELCGALEARSSVAAATPLRGERVACEDLSEELRSLLSPESIEECDSSPTSIEQRIIDYREAARRLRAIFEGVRVAAAAGGTAARCEACAALAELQVRVRDVSDSVILVEQPESRLDAAVNTEPAVRKHDAVAQAAAESCDSSIQTEVALGDVPRNDRQLQTLVDELNGELADAERRHEEERRKLSELISSLESSLEAMGEEYERCEEYWSSKLESERAAHEAEQRTGDERLAELLARVADYERHAPPAVLPPIEERAALEAQVADLESEFARHRAAAEEQLRARDAELRRLRARLEQLEPRRRRARDYRNPAYDAADDSAHRPAAAGGGAGGAGAGGAGAAGGPCACAALAERCGRLGASLAAARGAGAREAAALRGRAARAEAAVRRLHARLHAADLLVKDLYVENCQLAHTTALPRAT